MSVAVSIDHKHIDQADADAALAEPEPVLDDGLDDWEPDEAEVETRASAWPTRKWLAARITVLGGLLILFATHGWHLDEHTTIALITFLTESAVSYLVPNNNTPGGVPEKPVDVPEDYVDPAN